jgi:hypothetical protein
MSKATDAHLLCYALVAIGFIPQLFGKPKGSVYFLYIFSRFGICNSLLFSFLALKKDWLNALHLGLVTFGSKYREAARSFMVGSCFWGS